MATLSTEEIRFEVATNTEMTAKVVRKAAYDWIDSSKSTTFISCQFNSTNDELIAAGRAKTNVRPVRTSLWGKPAPGRGGIDRQSLQPDTVSCLPHQVSAAYVSLSKTDQDQTRGSW